MLERDELNTLFTSLVNANFNFDKTAVDVGANLGNHSVYFSKMFNRVVAFEADFRNFRLCELNTENAKNIVCENLALSNEFGYVAILNNDNKNSGKGSISQVRQSGTTEFSIQCITLDSYKFAADEQIGLLKIDVEGAEQQVLEGAKNIIALHRPVVLFEENSLSLQGDKRKSCVDFLCDIGYENFYITHNFATPIIDLGRKHKVVRPVMWIVEILLVTIFGSPNSVLQRINPKKLARKDYSLIVASCEPL